MFYPNDKYLLWPPFVVSAKDLLYSATDSRFFFVSINYSVRPTTLTWFFPLAALRSADFGLNFLRPPSGGWRGRARCFSKDFPTRISDAQLRLNRLGNNRCVFYNDTWLYGFYPFVWGKKPIVVYYQSTIGLYIIVICIRRYSSDGKLYTFIDTSDGPSMGIKNGKSKISAKTFFFLR